MTDTSKLKITKISSKPVIWLKCPKSIKKKKKIRPKTIKMTHTQKHLSNLPNDEGFKIKR